MGSPSLRDITPALVVHAATFLLVGVMWVGHHGALARVDKITHRALLFNLLILFWVTLLPFAAENAADRPLEPLGPSLLAFCCGAFFLSYLGFRFSVHSTIDDVAEMRRLEAGSRRDCDCDGDREFPLRGPGLARRRGSAMRARWRRCWYSSSCAARLNPKKSSSAKPGWARFLRRLSIRFRQATRRIFGAWVAISAIQPLRHQDR